MEMYAQCAHLEFLVKIWCNEKAEKSLNVSEWQIICRVSEGENEKALETLKLRDSARNRVSNPNPRTLTSRRQ